MRRLLWAVALIAGAASLTGCWDHRWGHDHPGHPSDHHDHGSGY